MPKKVDVTVQVNGTAIELLDEDKKGGNAHLKKQDQMRWHIEDKTRPFTLTFSDLDSNNDAQPFGKIKIGPTTDTTLLTVTNTDSTYCKYDVEIGGCDKLDPIIIVDKS